MSTVEFINFCKALKVLAIHSLSQIKFPPILGILGIYISTVEFLWKMSRSWTINTGPRICHKIHIIGYIQ